MGFLGSDYPKLELLCPPKEKLPQTLGLGYYFMHDGYMFYAI